MMNKWNGLIEEQDTLGKHCAHTLKTSKLSHLQERQMRLGFSRTKNETLQEPSEGEDFTLGSDDGLDARMEPMIKMK